MGSFGIRIDPRGFDEAAARLRTADAKLDAAMERAVRGGTGILEDEAVERINKRTGRTATTIGSDVVGMTGYVGSDDEIAGYLEYGTQPHFIPGAFGIPEPGGVDHPGTPEYAWLLRAGEGSVGEIEAEFVAEIGAALASI